MILWRLSNHTDLAGAGGMRAAGRWHSIGRPVVYLSEQPASCLVEAHVHDLDRAAIPRGYQWLEIAVEDGVPHETLAEVPTNWSDDLETTRGLGDAWLARRTSALLHVPSAWSPATRNVLLNPRHPAAARVLVVRAFQTATDLGVRFLSARPKTPSKRR